jgi:hypothetical protein
MPTEVKGVIDVTDRGGEHVTIGLNQITALGWSTGSKGKPHGGTIHLNNGMVIHLEAGEFFIAEDRELYRVAQAWNAYLLR